MKIKAICTISWPTNADEHDKRQVVIRVNDESSRAEFLQISFSHEDFSKMLGGLSYVPAQECEVRGLQFLGKKKIIQRRTLECPLDTYEKEPLRAWLVDQFVGSEWTPDTYLSSQGSVLRSNGKTILNFHVYKYVDSGDSVSVKETP